MTKNKGSFPEYVPQPSLKCPFKPINSNSCSKSCALYIEGRNPVCSIGRRKSEAEPIVNYGAIIDPVRKSLDEIAIQLGVLAEQIEVPRPAAQNPSDYRNPLDDWLERANPFEIANKTTKDVYESFEAWCRANNIKDYPTQRGATKGIVARTGILVNEAHKAGMNRYETTPKFLEWAQKKMQKGGDAA